MKESLFAALAGGSIGLLVVGSYGVSPLHWPLDAWAVFLFGLAFVGAVSLIDHWEEIE